MYRCSICNTLSGPRQSRLTHCIYREVPTAMSIVVAINLHGEKIKEVRQFNRKVISREIPVCALCHVRLQRDSTFKEATELMMSSGVMMPFRDRAAPPYKEGATDKPREQKVFPVLSTEDKYGSVTIVTQSPPESYPVNKPMITTHPVKIIKSKK